MMTTIDPPAQQSNAHSFIGEKCRHVSLKYYFSRNFSGKFFKFRFVPKMNCFLSKRIIRKNGCKAQYRKSDGQNGTKVQF